MGFIVNQDNAFIKNSPANDPFALNLSYRVNHNAIRTVNFVDAGKRDQVFVTSNGDLFKVKVNDGEWKTVSIKMIPEDGRFTLKINIDGNLFSYSCVITPERVSVFNEVKKCDKVRNSAVHKFYSTGWQDRVSTGSAEILERQRFCE